MDEWHHRLDKAIRASGLKQAEIARMIDETPDSVAKWRKGRVAQPRGDKMERVARALGVSLQWLRDGTGAARPDDPDLKPAERVSGEETMARLELGARIREARLEAQLGDPSSAVRGLSITARRWTLIEEGATAPTLVELQVIAERVRRSLDWLVAGYVTPINRSFETAPEQPSGRFRLHEEPGPELRRK